MAGGCWSLQAQTRRLPRIPTMALFHHRLPNAPSSEGSSAGGATTLGKHYGLTARVLQSVWREVCHSRPSQVLISWFWEQHLVAEAALCVPRVVSAMGCQVSIHEAQPSHCSSLNLHPDPCCSNESHAEGFPQAGFIELCYRKIQLRQPHCSQTNLSFLILPVTSLGI